VLMFLNAQSFQQLPSHFPCLFIVLLLVDLLPFLAANLILPKQFHIVELVLYV